jgi:hypothetical protein
MDEMLKRYLFVGLYFNEMGNTLFRKFPQNRLNAAHRSCRP